jgi:hypothetical protein
LKNQVRIRKSFLSNSAHLLSIEIIYEQSAYKNLHIYNFPATGAIQQCRNFGAG